MDPLICGAALYVLSRRIPSDTDSSAPVARERHGAEAPLGYRPALDGIRAIAIGLVLLHHTGAFLYGAGKSGPFPAGFLGVDVFLVLSGFLITTLLMERRAEPRRLTRFYARRALRLLPAVAALLIVNLGYAVIHGGVPSALRSIAVVLAYVTNWAELAGISISPYVTHLWSLAVEEQFYLLWPLMLFAALRAWASRRKLALLALAIALLAALWRLTLYDSGIPWLRLYLRTDARADALAIGALLALLPWRELTRRLPAIGLELSGVLGLVGVVAAAAVLQPYDGFLYRGGFTLVALACAVLIAAALDPRGGLGRALAARPLVLLGRLSYSLYLWHFGLFQIVAAHTQSWSVAPRVALAWTVTSVAASGSYLLVERPALALKRRVGRRAGPRKA